jgi:N-acetylglucosamine kinase-like BadF-type ATPase
MPHFFISVDGGATKTFAVCYDETGFIYGSGVSGSSNYRNTSIDLARNNLDIAVSNAISRAGLDKSQIEKFTFALAGVKDSKRSTEIIREFVNQLKLGNDVSLFNDGEAGFNCRFPGQDGIIAAPGTGMISYGKRGDRFERASGWGWFLGDEGAAFYIARRAMQECTNIYDGRLEIESQLPEKLMKYYAVDEPRDLVTEVYTTPLDIRRIAAFSQTVGNLANEGDELALKLLKESALAAGKCVIALKNRLYHDENITYSGYGGVFRSGNIYWNYLKETVNSRFPDAESVPPLFGYHAVIGSIFLVLKDAGALDHYDLESEVSELNKQVSNLPAKEKREFLFVGK